MLLYTIYYILLKFQTYCTSLSATPQLPLMGWHLCDDSWLQWKVDIVTVYAVTSVQFVQKAAHFCSFDCHADACACKRKPTKESW